MNSLSDSQPWEIRAGELQGIARKIAQDVELWAKVKGKRDCGLALFALIVELLVATRGEMRARPTVGMLPSPNELELQLAKVRGSILNSSRTTAEADYLLALLLGNELLRLALEPLFQPWRVARSAAVKEGSNAQPE